MNDEQLATLIAAINHGFERVLTALEARQQPIAGGTFEASLANFKTFDWSSIGASVVETDEDGVSMIRAANGKICKRRTNDKFGTEIWFSYPDGKKEDGTPDYKRVIEFREIDAPEPIGRKTMAALSSAKPSAATPAAAATQRASSAPATTPAQPAQPDPVIAALNALNLLINEATIEGVEVTTATAPQANDDAATLNMRASTLRNLIDAKKRSGAPPMAQAQPAEDVEKLDPSEGERIALLLQKGAKMLGNKGTTPAQDGQIVAVLNVLCGSEQRRHDFIGAVFGKPSFAQIAPPQRRALFEWMKPTGQGAAAKALNDKAPLAIRAVLAYADAQKELAGVPA